METRRRVAGLGRALSLVGVIVFAGSAHAADSGLSNPKVTFTAAAGGSAGTKLVGTGTELAFESQGQWLVFRVPLRSISTGVALVDRQMRDKFLEMEHFPMVELRVMRDDLFVPSFNGNARGDAKARLSLHGKSRDTSVHYAIQRQGESLQVTATLHIDLRAHGIDLPRQRGVALNPDVTVDVGFAALDRAVVANAPAER